ncbi:di-trans,poly-cis-decaprenylcistransferase [Candidatus Micrarchaeota archaeon]|nr:di-trans,poly-cis-decaprenylcistransferase [Candidatus Micrarchaeota archaeon]
MKPFHVAIIPDGNRRWAKQKNLPPLKGHSVGIKKLKDALKWAKKANVDILSLWILSTENLNRSEDEIKGLFKYFETEIIKHLKDKYVDKHKVKVNFIGEIQTLPPKLQKLIYDVEKKSSKYDEGKILNLFTAYGGRKEMLHAVNSILEKGLKNIDEKTFGNYLYTKNLPDPDLIIRTSGEIRISGLMPWQTVYSELYFSEKLWPDFNEKDFLDAIEEYHKRKRRFGK